MPSLKVSSKQLKILQEALDLYLRANLGQVERVMDPLLKYGFKDWNGVEIPYENLHALGEDIQSSKRLLNLASGSSHGVFSKNVSDAGHIAYDMLQVVRGYTHDTNPNSDPIIARSIMPTSGENLLEIKEDST